MQFYRKLKTYTWINRFFVILILGALTIANITVPTKVLAEQNTTLGNSDISVETKSILKDGAEIIDITAKSLHADALVVSITTPEKEVTGTTATYVTNVASLVDVVITYTLPSKQIETADPEMMDSSSTDVETHTLTVAVGAGLVGSLNPEIFSIPMDNGAAIAVNVNPSSSVEVKDIKLHGYDLSMSSVDGQNAFIITEDNLPVDSTYTIEVSFIKDGVKYNTQYTYILVQTNTPKTPEPQSTQLKTVQPRTVEPETTDPYPGYTSDLVSLHVLLPNENSGTIAGNSNQYYNGLGAGLISLEGITYLNANKRITGADNVSEYLGDQVFVDIDAEDYEGQPTVFSNNEDWDAYDVMYDMAINGTDKHRESLLSLTDKDGNLLFTAGDAASLGEQIRAIERNLVYQFEIEWYFMLKTSGQKDNGTTFIKTYHVDGVILDKQQNVTVEYYDSDKTTLLHTETVTKNIPLSFIQTEAITQSAKVGTTNETYFAGWVDVEGSPITFDNATSISNNYQLFAVEKYDITYDKGLGTGINSVVSLDVYSSNVNAQASAFTPPEGHIFTHWNAYQNGTLVVQFEVNDALTFNHINTTLVAQYEVGNFNVIYMPGYSFSGREGNLSTAADIVKDSTINQQFAYNTAPSVGAEDLFAAPNEGYKFAYWSVTNAYGNTLDQNVKYHPITKNVVMNITDEFPQLKNNLELTANWSLVEFNIAYELDGGTVSTANRTQYTIEDTFSFNNPTKEGYIFTGWDVELVTADLGDLTKVTEQDLTTTVNKGTTGNLLVTANWQIVEFNIAYELDGGTVSTANRTQYTIEDAFIFNNPTKEGYTFIGWDVELVTAGSGDLTKVTERDFITTVNKGTFGNLLVTANWVEELPTYKTSEVYKGETYKITAETIETYLNNIIPTGSTVTLVEGDIGRTDVGTTNFLYEVQYPQEFKNVKLTVSGNTFSVTPATLIITADSYRVNAREPLPNPLGFKTTGLVGKDKNETLASLGIDVEITRTFNTLIPVAKYNSNALVENYKFEYENGSVTVVVPIVIPEPTTTTTITTTTAEVTTTTTEETTTSTQVITEQSTPEQGGTTAAVIIDDETPEVGVDSNAWALINLIASITGMLMAIFLIVSKTKKEDEEEKETLNRRKSWKLISAVVAIVSIIVFILTQDMTAPMKLVDQWTILMLVFTALNIVSLVYGRKWHEVEEETV